MRIWLAAAAVISVLAAASPGLAQLDADGRLRGAAYNNKPDELTQAIAAGADVNSTDQNGYTALMWAAQNNRLDMVQVLLDHGADPNLKSATGLTAARLGRDYPKVLALLKAHGAQIPAGYVVAGQPAAVAGPAAAAPVQAKPKPPAPAAAPAAKLQSKAPAKAATPAKPVSASTKAYCKTMYARAYALCGSSARDCKIIAASNWETCEATGRWP
jgi:hypothetical protein